jgi:Leucine-rich repeat (LRR) protein
MQMCTIDCLLCRHIVTGNEIAKVEGLENLRDLLELVLDRNKVKQIGEFSFISQQRLQELHIEENRLRSLANLQCLDNLRRLYIGMNRIQVSACRRVFVQIMET